MALQTWRPHRRVDSMIEAQRDGLRREDGTTRTSVSRSAGRPGNGGWTIALSAGWNDPGQARDNNREQQEGVPVHFVTTMFSQAMMR
jgi:hypothetical protein